MANLTEVPLPAPAGGFAGFYGKGVSTLVQLLGVGGTVDYTNQEGEPSSSCSDWFLCEGRCLSLGSPDESETFATKLGMRTFLWLPVETKGRGGGFHQCRVLGICQCTC